MLTVKCIEISDHYVVYQELTQCFRSVVFQNKQTNKQFHRKRDQICGYQRLGVREGELEEGSQKVPTSSYETNKY